MLLVTAARSAVIRLHIEARPGPLVVAVLPATYRAASRAASDVSMAKEYPRPISSTPATSTIRTGRASESSTRAWPLPRLRGSTRLSSRFMGRWLFPACGEVPPKAGMGLGPEGLISKLFVVAPPIGNLEDGRARALRVLGEVSAIAAEGTRITTRPLARPGIRKAVLRY